MASIHDACKKGDFNSVAELLSSDPSLVHSLDEIGNAPLYYAAMFGHTKVVALLIAKGADVNQQNARGDTAEGIARNRGYDDLYRRLRGLPSTESSSHPGADGGTPSVEVPPIGRGARVSDVANGIADWGLALLRLNILGTVAVCIGALQGDTPPVLVIMMLLGGCISAFVVRAMFVWASEMLKTLGDIAGYNSETQN